MVNMALRFLFIDELSILGKKRGTKAFELHWEFLLQLTMIPRLKFNSKKVNAEEANEIADKLEEFIAKGEHWWGLHLSLWGDPEAKVVKQLIKFLRGGAFTIVDLRKTYPMPFKES